MNDVGNVGAHALVRLDSWINMSLALSSVSSLLSLSFAFAKRKIRILPSALVIKSRLKFFLFYSLQPFPLPFFSHSLRNFSSLFIQSTPANETLKVLSRLKPSSISSNSKWRFQVQAHFRLQKKKNDLAWLWLSILDLFRQRLSKVGNQFKSQYTIPWPFHINVDCRIKLNKLKTAQMQISLVWFTGYFCFCLKSHNWEDVK